MKKWLNSSLIALYLVVFSESNSSDLEYTDKAKVFQQFERRFERAKKRLRQAKAKYKSKSKDSVTWNDFNLDRIEESLDCIGGLCKRLLWHEICYSNLNDDLMTCIVSFVKAKTEIDYCFKKVIDSETKKNKVLWHIKIETGEEKGKKEGNSQNKQPQKAPDLIEIELKTFLQDYLDNLSKEQHASSRKAEIAIKNYWHQMESSELNKIYSTTIEIIDFLYRAICINVTAEGRDYSNFKSQLSNVKANWLWVQQQQDQSHKQAHNIFFEPVYAPTKTDTFFIELVQASEKAERELKIFKLLLKDLMKN